MKLSFLVFPVLLSSMFSGCYYFQQGWSFLSYRQGARDVASLLADANTQDDARSFLVEVERIRNFSRQELMLADNDNYSRYAEIDRDFLAYVVSACAPFAFETYRWSYPVVGDAPYRGFYELEDARGQAQELTDLGYDVWIRRVEAFSTLGYFDDLLYSFMTSYPVHRLAELLIHEQTHATFWITDDASLNEDLASFIGDTGSREYIYTYYGEQSEEAALLDAMQRDSETFTQDMLKLKEQLEQVYARDLTQEQMEEAKQNTIDEFKERFSETYDERYSTSNYRHIAELPINNAFLDLFHLYSGKRWIFEKLYEEAGQDLKAFTTRITEMYEQETLQDFYNNATRN